VAKITAVGVQTYGVIGTMGKDGLEDPGSIGSRNRIRAACKLVASGVIERGAYFLFPQGYQRHTPSMKLTPDQVSFGGSVRAYARCQPELSGCVFLHEPLTYGTKQDMRAMYYMIAGYVPKFEGDFVHFHFVTDRAHLRRVWLVWKLTHPKGWTADFHVADGHVMTCFERYVREPAALVWYSMCLLPGLILAGRPGLDTLLRDRREYGLGAL
jgi:hypothetical protein